MVANAQLGTVSDLSRILSDHRVHSGLLGRGGRGHIRLTWARASETGAIFEGEAFVAGANSRGTVAVTVTGAVIGTPGIRARLALITLVTYAGTVYTHPSAGVYVAIRWTRSVATSLCNGHSHAYAQVNCSLTHVRRVRVLALLAWTRIVHRLAERGA